jgi:hypothetical protein
MYDLASYSNWLSLLFYSVVLLQRLYTEPHVCTQEVHVTFMHFQLSVHAHKF